MDNTDVLERWQLELLVRAASVIDETGESPAVVPESVATGASMYNEQLQELIDAEDGHVVDLGDKAGVDKPAVVDASEAREIDAARDALQSIVADLRGLDESTVEQMSLSALSSEIDACGTESAATTLADLSQYPEAGGAPLSDDGPEGVDALSSHNEREVRDLLDKADAHEDRLPMYAEEQRDRALELVPGVDSVDELRTQLAEGER